VDTTRGFARNYDLDEICGEYFPAEKPIVFFISGSWLGNNGNIVSGGQSFVKVLDIVDQKNDKQFHQMIVPVGINAFLYRYKGRKTDELKALTDPLGIKSFYWPHHTDTSVFTDRRLEKIYDICFYGTTNGQTYPFRERLKKLIKAHYRPERFLLIRREQRIKGEQLSRLIGQSWLTVATTVGDHDRFVNKYQEIPLSGSTILGNMPTRHRREFEGFMVEVTPEMTDRQILDEIDRALTDKPRLARMSEELGRRFKAEYNLDVGEERFSRIMESLYGESIGSGEAVRSAK